MSRQRLQSKIRLGAVVWLLLCLCLAVLFLAGCSDSETPPVVVPVETIEQTYLFDVYHVNAAWEYELAGIYIDNQGDVVRYDHSFERWVAGDYGNLTEAELSEKYIAPHGVIATIDQATLREKVGLVEAARLGELSERVQVGNDMGGGSYVCYAYDSESGKYTQVLLELSGDFTQSNLSPEAVELTNWLRSVLDAAIENQLPR